MLADLPFIGPALLSFGVIVLAEFGDKSQLVCMTLAARHQSRPVIIGATLAFLLLNGLAVTVGSVVTQLVPPLWVNLAATALFILFGLHSLFANDDEEDEQQAATLSKKSIVLTAFSLIFLAELGDKTQLAVATMATTHNPLAVWLGSSLALLATTVIGVIVGMKLLKLISPQRLHRLSGLLFIVLGITIAITKVLPLIG